MAKVDKEYTWRMQGMTHALEVAKKSGVDGLEKEVRMRGLLRAPLAYTNTQIDNFWGQLSQNLYATVITVSAMSLHDAFGFGKERIRRWKNEFNKKTESALNLDWLGEHFVSLEDYAVYLNEQYDLGIDVSRVAVCQDSYDDGNKNFRKASVDRMIELLKEGGFDDAAEYLDGKVR